MLFLCFCDAVESHGLLVLLLSIFVFGCVVTLIVLAVAADAFHNYPGRSKRIICCGNNLQHVNNDKRFVAVDVQQLLGCQSGCRKTTRFEAITVVNPYLTF